YLLLATCSRFPNGSLLRPRRIGILRERLRRFVQRLRIAARLVARDARPVQRFWRRVRERVLTDDVAEALFGGGELPFGKGGVAPAAEQLGQEIFDRQEAFDPVPDGAFAVDDEYG